MFHILKNLGEAVEGTLARHLAAHRKRQVERSCTPPPSPEHAFSPPKVFSKKAALSQAKREERLARYQHVVALRKQGFSQTAIAAQVGIGHATVSCWLRSETCPEQLVIWVRLRQILGSHVRNQRQS